MGVSALCQWTKMYPMALMLLSPLSSAYSEASFPHELASSEYPPVPNPILKSQVEQTSWSFPTIPILAVEELLRENTTLKPLLVTISLQRSLSTDERFPRISTNWDGAVLPVSDQWRQRAGGFVQGSKSHLLANLHTEDRSWRRAYSNRLVAWFLVYQTQSSLLQGWTCPCCSKGWNRIVKCWLWKIENTTCLQEKQIKGKMLWWWSMGKANCPKLLKIYLKRAERCRWRTNGGKKSLYQEGK